MSKQTLIKIFAGLLVAVAFITLVSFVIKSAVRVAAPPKTDQSKCKDDGSRSVKCVGSDSDFSKKDKIKKFKSEKEFKEYIAKAENARGGVGGMLLGESDDSMELFSDSETGISAPIPTNLENKLKSVGRVSGTNVQVLGIDEPDVVKTDGQEIYFSQERYFKAMSFPDVRGFDDFSVSSFPTPPILPPVENENGVQIIKAFPLSEIAKVGKIDTVGNLLLSGDVLAVFSGQSILGYNITDPKSPKELWKIDLKENNSLAGARLYNDKIYIVTRKNIFTSHPCPLEPVSMKGMAYPVRCEEIYYPEASVPADSTFTAMAIDIKSGEIEDSTSIVGSTGNSIVYMSENALYITYGYSGDLIAYTYGFFKEQSDLVPAEVVEKIAKLKEYDISDSSKLNELSIILQKHQNSLDKDEKLKLESEMQNRMEDYAKRHKRELERTGIIKLNVKGLDLTENGNVPGRLLNQFSLDEYQGNLRVAVTVGGGWVSGMGSSTESSNDVYILNSDLKEAGSIQDLGKEERIYSVRFLEDKGYLVTFKQVDPFFVLDLADPKNPQVKGELKIPGYSSYLHPISQNRILGIGKEDNQVKISLFDVSNPSSPVEKSKYTLDEYWSEILNTQHAFLQDKKHEIFFLPGGKGAYIFYYKNDELKLAKAVSETQVKRALYINDYLYLVEDNKVTVLDENNWEKVRELEL